MATEEQRDLIDQFRETFPDAYTVEDTMRLCFKLQGEIERLKESNDHLLKRYLELSLHPNMMVREK